MSMQPTRTQVDAVRTLEEVDPTDFENIGLYVDASSVEEVAASCNVPKGRLQKYLDGVGSKGDNALVQMMFRTLVELNP